MSDDLNTTEILCDGSTVWVNSWQGHCLARFGPRGIDVHKDFAAQASGGSQCLDCVAGPTNLAAWRAFQIAMHRHHAISVDDQYMPDFIREELYHAGR